MSWYYDWAAWFSEGKALSDDDVLEDLPVGTTATMFFQDLGPQLGWTMVKKASYSSYSVYNRNGVFVGGWLQVFLAECLGPLFIYLLFYYRLPYIYGHEYDFTQSPFKVVKWVQTENPYSDDLWTEYLTH